MNPDQEFDRVAAWSKGVHLQNAYVHFAPPASRQTYSDYLARAPWMVESMNVIADALNQPEAILPGQRVTAEERDAHHKLRDTLRAALLGYVKKGQLRAVGFAYPRKPEDKPCEVPSDLWSQNVNWSADRVEGNGMRIDAVRICHPSWLLPPPKEVPVQPTSKKRGRPSDRPLILEAYGECKKTDKIDFSGKKKDAVAAVRAWLKLNRTREFNNGDNFGHRLIEKVISEDFDAERASRPTE